MTNPDVPHRPALIMTRVGGREYPLATSPNCGVCNHPDRLFIEQQIIMARSHAQIVRALDMRDHGGPDISTPQIKRHIANEHMPMTAVIQRAIIDNQAQKIGRSIESEMGPLVDYVSAAELVVQRGFERMADGEIQPNVNDMLTAGKFLHTVSLAAGGNVSEQAWQEALMVYMEVAQEFIPQDRWLDYAKALSTNPILAAIGAGKKDAEVVASEVVAAKAIESE